MVTNKKSLETINDHRRILSKMQLQTQFSFNKILQKTREIGFIELARTFYSMKLDL